ncbi:MAG: ErpK protein [Blautia sp.]|nr:ErpK protein [Blautia sp.]
MARRSIPIEEKIESQKELVSKAKDRYEAELDKLEKLMRKRDELRSKELMEAFANSERSFEEVMRFLTTSEEETDA